MTTKASLQAICYQGGKLQILNQLLLPNSFEYEDCSNTQLAFDAIKQMKVRGAPAIAIVAALGLACEVQSRSFENDEELRQFIFSNLDQLCQSRPTAVNLFQMADFMKGLVSEKRENLKETFLLACEQFFQEDVQTNKSIGRYGKEVILKKSKDQPVSLLTHCNTGSLATAGYGTALGVIRALHEDGKLNHAYATETRPYNQGARLTAFELVYEKIPSTLITDSMSSFLMKQKKIDGVVVGADRVAANGDTANKIGTYGLAIAAQFHGIPFYVAAPKSSIDLKTKSGSDIHIEERPKEELLYFQNKPISVEGIQAWNPSFDVTPAHLITAIITEDGVVYPNQNGLFDLGFVKNHD